MNENLQINTRVNRLVHYIENIENGYIQIPSFQRDYIWDNSQKKELFESISKGYPIGSLLLWKPKEDYNTKPQIGPYQITVRSKEYFYILDGFQRLSTIFGCLKNPDKSKDIDIDMLEKEYSIFYDLEKEEFFVPRSTGNVSTTQVPVYVFVDTFAFLTFANKLQNELREEEEKALLLIERAKKLSTTFSDFTLPSIEITGGKIEDAMEIFTRINSKGSTITPDWMLSALTNNEDAGFNLGKLINDLLIDIEPFNYEKIKRELVVQCIQNSFGKVYFDISVEEISKKTNFKQVADKTICGIKKAVKFLFEELSVVNSKLLPYNNQLIFMTDFFNRFDVPSESQKNDLKDWFWQTTYSNYFTIFSLSKIREAYYQFQKYLDGKSNDLLYNDNPEKHFTVIDFPNKIFYGSVRAKALILFLLNHSNNFKSISSDQPNYFEIFNLFNTKNEDGNYPPEGFVPIIFNEQTDSFFRDAKKARKSKDLYEFLKNRKTYFDFERCFLAKEMFFMENEQEVLFERKRMIMKAEKDFVEKENIGLKYDQKVI